MYYKEETIKSFDGTPLYVRVSGDTDKPLLLLIHGGGTDSDFYVHTAETLSRSFHVVAYNRRGHVKSFLTPTTESPKDATKEDKAALKDILSVHVEDAAAVLSEYATEVDKALGAYVVCHSMGGPIGMLLTVRHPELVRKTLVIEPAWEIRHSLRNGLKAVKSPIYFKDERGPAATQEMVDNIPIDQEMMTRFDNKILFTFRAPVEELKKAPILFAVGEQSKGNLIYEETVRLAKETGKPLFYHPGVHNTGFNLPKEFAYLVTGALLDPDF